MELSKYQDLEEWLAAWHSRMPPETRWADQLPAALWDDLVARPSQEAAQAAEAKQEGDALVLPLAAREFHIDPIARSINNLTMPDRRVDYTTGVLILSHMARALDAPPSGEMAAPQDLPGGRTFFVGSHTPPTKPLVRRFGNDLNLLKESAAKLGAEEIPGADLALNLPGLPRIPLSLLYWQGDDSAPPRTVICLDSRAHLQLDLAGVLALLHHLVMRLIEESFLLKGNAHG